MVRLVYEFALIIILVSVATNYFLKATKPAAIIDPRQRMLFKTDAPRLIGNNAKMNARTIGTPKSILEVRLSFPRTSHTKL